MALDEIRLPPAPKRVPTDDPKFQRYQDAVAQWTRDAEKAVRQLERSVRALETSST